MVFFGSSCRVWMFALPVCLLALVIHLVMYDSFCKESQSHLCRVNHLIGFYRLAWRLERLQKLFTRPDLAVAGKGPTIFPHHLLWMAPFLSGGGYCSEALAFISGLADGGFQSLLTVEQHGDLASEAFWNGLPANTKNILVKSFRPGWPLNDTVVICHSEPGAWYPPLFQTYPCPPTGYDDPLYVVGRTMFETDRLSPEHVIRCNWMDEIWVPSDFNMETFARSGVDPSKLVKIGQSVDVRFFDPKEVKKPLVLPTAGRIFGPESSTAAPSDCFVFLSIFKWELRKGWDILIQAYLREFSIQDNVVLFIQTNAYHSGRVYEDEIRAYIEKIGIEEPRHGWPRLYVSDEHVPQTALPSLYKAANVFVLPSRGEGWGRPHVEAMSMALPVIATNWSGMTEYMTGENSYPLLVEKLVELPEGPFKGHLWADPSMIHLQFLMRHAYTHPAQAKAKGLLARKTMMDRFSPAILTQEVIQHLSRIAMKKANAMQSV